MITKGKWLIFLSFIIFLTLAAARIFTNMPFGEDEAYLAEPAVNLVRNGFLGQTIGRFGEVPWEDTARYTYWYPPLSFMFGAVVYKLFGVGLFQARFISMFWGLVGLISIYYLARTFFKNNKKAVILSLFLVAVDYFYVSSSSTGRMDMMAASLSLVGFAIYFVWRKKNFNLAVFLSNLFICLSGLTHPNGLFGFLILTFLIFYLDRKNIRVKTVFLGLIPYILGIVGWGAYIIQDIEAFKMQFLGSLVFRPGSYSWVTGIKWASIYQEIVSRYFYGYGLSPSSSTILGIFKFPIFLFFMFNLLIAPFILKGKIKTIWYMLIICFLSMMFLSANDEPCYLCWITPLFILNSVDVWNQLNKKRLLNKLYFLSFAYIIIISIAGVIYGVKRNLYLNLYLADLREFDKTYYTEGKIYGISALAFFYDFDKNIIQDDITMGFLSGIKPRYFVVEEVYRYLLNKIKNEQEIENYITKRTMALLEKKYKIWIDGMKERGGVRALWDYIHKNLNEEYTQVFKGKYYTFYERKDDRKNEFLAFDFCFLRILFVY